MQSGKIKIISTYKVRVTTISSMLSFAIVNDCYVRDT